MIKINLLDSVTDRAKGVAAVEERVTTPYVQTVIMGLVVVGLLCTAMAYDFVSARTEHNDAQVELARQKQIQERMQLVAKEQAELEKKTNEVQNRINAIQKLRSSQQGPSEVLREIKERIDSIAGLYLESVEQKGEDLTIEGGSPNESSVTRFGQSLEFSSGMFSNLSIETERKTVEPSAAAPLPKGVVAAPVDPKAEKPEIVNFTVKCKFTPHSTQPATTQSAQAPPASTTVAQVNQAAQK